MGKGRLSPFAKRKSLNIIMAFQLKKFVWILYRLKITNDLHVNAFLTQSLPNLNKIAGFPLAQRFVVV